MEVLAVLGKEELPEMQELLVSLVPPELKDLTELLVVQEHLAHPVKLEHLELLVDLEHLEKPD